MSYSSPAAENCLIIDDTFDPDVPPVDPQSQEPFGKGLEERNLNEDPIGGFAAKFALPLIPRSEWKDRIEQREKDGATLRGKMQRANLYALSQAQTNFCWDNAVTMATMIVRLLQGQRLVRLSPASTACKITNFRNVGGWGTQALKYIATVGALPQDIWPANAIDRKYDKPENDGIRKMYRVTEWWDLKPRSFDEKMACLFYGIPVACGYNWWGHEICAVDPVILKDGRFGTMEINSWDKTWGDNGYCILTEAKSIPDDAVAPKVAIAA